MNLQNPEIRQLDAAASGFLQEPALVKLFDLFAGAGAMLRVNGGAVRNALMGEAIGDVDLSTDLLPSEVQALLSENDLKSVPTGIEHGTITAIVEGQGFEITTLREDIETDGRHAVVKFGKDWQADAMRRDFTVNAIYADRHGKLYDYVGGFNDVHKRNIRFIGDAHERIAEDALRILRFFRFFAWYGPTRVGRPDADGLRAATRAKSELNNLSVERVWTELRKLLAAPNPTKALLWMRTTGVLALLLPETEKWGIDAIGPLCEMEAEQGWFEEGRNDALLRLAAIIPLRQEVVRALAKRLKFSNADEKALLKLCALPALNFEADELQWLKLFYHQDAIAMSRALKIAIALARGRSDGAAEAEFARRLAQLEAFDPPRFPISGDDLLAQGIEAGPKLGEKLEELLDKWVQSGFSLDAKELLNEL